MNTHVTAVELEHCREAALVKGGLFEFTSRYLPAERSDEYMALYAIVRTIHSIPDAHVDESVKWAKLKWWSEELLAEPGSVSRHPVLRALWTTGARSKIDASLLQSLVSDAVTRIDMAPCSDENDLYARLAALGSTKTCLELAIDEQNIEKHSLQNLSAASGLLGVLSSFTKGNNAEYNQIPLNVLAKYNLSVQQLEQQPAELAKVISHLAEFALGWLAQGVSGLADLKKNRAGQHLQLSWAMEGRILKYIKDNAISYLKSGYRYGPGDAWFAWRFLRRLNG